MKKATTQEIAEQLEHFIMYVSSPWRLMWMNFLAGVFRGLGAIVGVSLLIGLLVWILSLFADLPLIGEYFGQIKETITSYLENANYNDEFSRVEKTLHDIEQKIDKP